MTNNIDVIKILVAENNCLRHLLHMAIEMSKERLTRKGYTAETSAGTIEDAFMRMTDEFFSVAGQKHEELIEKGFL